MSHSGEGSGTSDAQQRSPPAAELFEVLGDTERQVLLRHLLARAEPVSVDELVEVFTAVFEHERSRAVLRLRHDHLPRLAASGIVTYDTDADEVRIDGEAGPTDHDELRTLLERADDIASRTAGTDD